MDRVKWVFPGINVPCVYLIHISLCRLIYIDGGCKKSVAVCFLQPGSVLPDFIIIMLSEWTTFCLDTWIYPVGLCFSIMLIIIYEISVLKIWYLTELEREIKTKFFQVLVHSADGPMAKAAPGQSQEAEASPSPPTC